MKTINPNIFESENNITNWISNNTNKFNNNHCIIKILFWINNIIINNNVILIYKFNIKIILINLIKNNNKGNKLKTINNNK